MNIQQKFIPVILFGLIGLFLIYSDVEAEELPKVTVAIVTDGPWKRFNDIPPVFEKEILELTKEEFDVQFIDPEKNRADWTLSGIKQNLDTILTDPNVDLVITLGAVSSHVVCHMKDHPKPVIAPIVIDRELQNLPFKSGTSGVKNLNYVTSLRSAERDLKTFLEIVPFKKLGLIIKEVEGEAFSLFTQNIETVAKTLGVEVVTIPVHTSIDDTINSIPEDVDAVYLGFLGRLSEQEFDRLVQGLIQKKLPSFSIMGKVEVERGLLVGTLPDEFVNHLARKTALNARRILLGEEAGNLRVSFTPGGALFINMATARAISVYPKWKVLSEAQLLFQEEEKIERKLTLNAVVEEAIQVNLDLAVTGKAVLAGAQNVKLARSDLLPQINIGALGEIIDDDRAKAGSKAERTITGSVNLSQNLYSERAWASFDIERHEQRRREKDLETLRLDIVLETTLSYLNVLKSYSVEQIRKENLKLTKSNLESARIRKAVGYSGPEEVFRWESELANEKIEVLGSQAQRKISEKTLNRVLNRPIDEKFQLEETDLESAGLITQSGKVFRYTDNPWSFKRFINFMVEEGITNSPEIQEVDAAIQSRKRALVSAKRSYWVPTFTLESALSDIFSEGGEEGPPSSADDTDWSIGINATLPLYEGGARNAEKIQAQEEISQFELLRRSFVERIDERVRKAMDRTSASKPSIELSQDALEASLKNLDLVKDTYARGVSTITDLIDAQNAWLVADLVAVNSVYDFLIDIMEVSRATAFYPFLLNDSEVEEWFIRLDQFFIEEKGKIGDESG